MGERKESQNKMMRKIKEAGIRGALFIAAIFATLVIFSILYFLLSDGIPIFQEVGLISFLTGVKWNPTGIPPSYGTWALMVGTILVTALAMLFAIPLSIGCALYISEIASPRMKNIIKPAIELLAGIPSVVYGFFGLVILTNWIRIGFDKPTGETWLAGSILLAVMALPTIASVAEDAISSVPRSFKEGSLAMGATRWETISRVILPSSLSGITAAIILGIGRAVGETMAVMMVCGNPPYGLIPDPITDVFTPVKTLTATLGIEMGEVAAGSTHYHALFGVAVILLVFTLAINISATVILGRIKKKHLAGAKRSKKRVVDDTIAQRVRTVWSYGWKIFATLLALYLFGFITTCIALLAIALFILVMRRISSKKKQTLAFSVIGLCVVIAGIILSIILGYIIINGIPAISWGFLTTPPSNLGRSGGISTAILGTLYLAGGAIALALPLGICAAIYLVEYTREGWMTKIIRTGADLLNGTPSIVFGLFGFAFLVLYLEWGYSLIAGIVTLALMIVPTIMRTTEEALKSVPDSMREGSLALGATKWQTITRVVLSPAAPGVITGSILGIGRAVGETAPIMFTAVAFSAIVPTSLFDPVNALPYHLFVLATSIPGSSESQAGTALVLLILVVAIYLVAIVIRNHYKKIMKW